MTLTPGAVVWPVELRSPFHAFMTVVVGTLVVLLVGLGVSRFFGAQRRSSVVRAR